MCEGKTVGESVLDHTITNKMEFKKCFEIPVRSLIETRGILNTVFFRIQGDVGREVRVCWLYD